MKTLIFNGSPKKNGDTVALLNILKTEIDGKINQIDTYFCNIKPCVDCRYCWEHPSCSIKDEMQNVFSLIDKADNIVIASPIYFSELSGSLLSALSRLQYLYVSKHFRNDNILTKKKRNGIIILSGGGDGSPKKAEDTATCLLHHMGAEVIGTVCSHDTNSVSAKDDKRAVAEIKAIAERILRNEPNIKVEDIK